MVFVGLLTISSSWKCFHKNSISSFWDSFSWFFIFEKTSFPIFSNITGLFQKYHSWQRVLGTSLFYEESPYIAYPPFLLILRPNSFPLSHMFIFRASKVLLKLICLMLETRVVHFFGMLKGKSIDMIYPCLLSHSEKIYSKTLPTLGTQIRCAQNQCTTVKMTLNIYVIHKYIYICIYIKRKTV